MVSGDLQYQQKNNMLSTEESRPVHVHVHAYIAEKLTQGRIVGPLSPDIAEGIHISCFGVIPKRSSPDKWCLIIDQSHPEQHSVKDGIDPTLCRVHYSSIDEAVRHILTLGRRTSLAQVRHCTCISKHSSTPGR